MKIPGWLKRKSKLDRRRDLLAGQVEMAADFYKFAKAAYDRGFATDLILQVDGQRCSIGVNMREGKTRELFEYLCNFAATEKLYAVDRLGQFYNAGMNFPTGSRGDGDNEYYSSPLLTSILEDDEILVHRGKFPPDRTWAYCARNVWIKKRPSHSQDEKADGQNGM